MKSIIILAIALVSLAVAEDKLPAKEPVRACYYSNWSQHRPGTAKYLPENYEIGMCSHIFFAFVGMDEEFKLKPLEMNDLDHVADGKPVLGLYNRINDLKTKQSDLKTLLAFGGFLFGRDETELMRKMLAKKRKSSKIHRRRYQSFAST
jgi:chitinase